MLIFFVKLHQRGHALVKLRSEQRMEFALRVASDKLQGTWTWWRTVCRTSNKTFLTCSASSRMTKVMSTHTSLSTRKTSRSGMKCSIRDQRRNLDRNVHLSKHCTTFVGTVLLLSFPWHWLWRFSWTCSVWCIGADCSQVSTLSGHWRDACCIPSARKRRAYLSKQCVLWARALDLGTHEYVNVSMVTVVYWITKGRDVNEEPVAVYFVFDDFSHGFPRRCWVHRF